MYDVKIWISVLKNNLMGQVKQSDIEVHNVGKYIV